MEGLTKLPKYDIKDTNIELLGSDVCMLDISFPCLLC